MKRIFMLLIGMASAAGAFAYDVIHIDTELVASPARVVISCPDSTPPKSGWPTLYLLHGFQGNYMDWAKHTNIDSIAQSRGIVIVCPDGGNLWYWDSPSASMESYISSKLVNVVDSLYPTDPAPHSRTIAGLSMGGHGAVWIGGRHPQVFGSIASMSGALDTGSPSVRNQADIPKVIGRYEQNPQLWESLSAMTVVPMIARSGQRIWLTCGTNDFLYDDNVRFSRALTSAGVAHKFITPSGSHTWSFWVSALPAVIDFALSKQ